MLEQLLGSDAKVVATVICGDNYAVENLPTVALAVTNVVKESNADLFFAGPCFQAGRYGTAAGEFCVSVQSQLGIPAITGMYVENPGVDLYRESVCIVDSGPDVSGMKNALTTMARLGSKLVNNEPMGRPAAEGYISQGLLRSEFVNQTAAYRLGQMLLLKIRGEEFISEVPSQPVELIPAPLAVRDLSRATLAIVTDGGLVPTGNPDQIPRAFARVWGAYNFEEQISLASGEYEVAHGGYDNRYVEQDPHRLIPVDVLRELVHEGHLGKLHGEFVSTTGNVNPLENSRRMGREIAARLKEAGVDSVILTST
jgi:glycine reductase